MIVVIRRILSHGAAAVLLLTAVGARTAAAQAQASLGAGASTVRYAGGSTLSSAALSPAFRFSSPNLDASFSGTLASLPQAAWFEQGNSDLWGATPAVLGGLRVGAEAVWSGSTRSDGGWTAAAHGVAELLWWTKNWGVGVGAGPSAGWVEGEPSVVAFHGRARGWWQAGDAAFALGVEPTRFLGAWFTDISASAAVNRGALAVWVWGAARASQAYGSKGAASALVQVFVAPIAALELGGGSYLPDPYQSFPRAGYFTAGFRLFARSPRPRAAAEPQWPALTPQQRGDSLVVRFRLTGASSVAIAGDWNAWQPVPLQSLMGDLWEGTLALSRGTYHFSLLVDGKEWVVPRGVAVVPDGLGSIVGVLAVN